MFGPFFFIIIGPFFPALRGPSRPAPTRYLEEGAEALEPKNGNPYAALHTSKSLSEVERLRLIIAKQEVEIARLKKGYWVEGVGANKEYVTGSGKTTKSSKN